MKILYIGQFSPGTTSKMRAEGISRTQDIESFDVIDTHIPFYETFRFWRSLGFRYRKGPLITNINNHILKNLKSSAYDLIWVDKGLFLQERTLDALRKRTKKLVHYTPDPAFAYNKSELFEKTIPYYDFMITTKSFELEDYKKMTDPSKVILTTQGFDKAVHKRSGDIQQSKNGVIFIGRYEKSREEVIDLLLQKHIEVTLAGSNWKTFANKNKNNKNLSFLGSGLFGADYVKEIQKAKIGWGSLSKWFLELHTTRTFEIPACGTALLTERNEETTTFFSDEEAIFYQNPTELIKQVDVYLNDDQKLETITNMGYNKVHASRYDYESILEDLMQRIL